MNREVFDEKLKKIIMTYSTSDTDDPKELHALLQDLNLDDLISVLVGLLTMYYNDKNSSRLRELTTLWIAGFEPNYEKLGYNGYRLDEKCEVKPQNTWNESKKLDGGGSFNDYTPERFEQDLEENPTILCSGFVQGKLIYVLRFKFACIKDKLETQLNKKFQNKARKRGDYLRSARFSFKDYEKCDTLELVYLRKNWREFTKYLSKKIDSYLRSCEKP